MLQQKSVIWFSANFQPSFGGKYFQENSIFDLGKYLAENEIIERIIFAE